jgi:type II secretory pathway component PulF
VSSAPRSPAAGEDLALLHRTLAELCRADVPLPRALRTLEADIESSPLRDAVRAMADEVEAGAPFAEAYAAHADRFPPAYRALVEAGAASGDLPGVLGEIARHASERAEVAARLRRALAWPMVTAGFVVAIGAALLVFVAPAFEELSATVVDGSNLWWSGSRQSGSFLAGRWFAAGAAVGLLALSALVGGAIVWLRHPIDGSAAGAARSYRLPVLGPLRHGADVASVASTLALLVRRRVPLPRALDLAAETAGTAPLRARVLAAADAAHDGRGIADSVREAGLFAPSLVWIIEAAERRGEAADALDDVACIYRRRLSRAADRAAVVVTPVAEIVVGIAVLTLAYAFISPLLEFTRRIIGG